jgi:L-serine deaminase
MVRSAAAVLTFLILPGIALAEQAQGTHIINVGLGDEFTFFNQVDTDAAQGCLQVVGAQAGMAAARVVHISSPVFEQGVVVRLTKKMR